MTDKHQIQASSASDRALPGFVVRFVAQHMLCIDFNIHLDDHKRSWRVVLLLCLFLCLCVSVFLCLCASVFVHKSRPDDFCAAPV